LPASSYDSGLGNLIGHYINLAPFHYCCSHYLFKMNAITVLLMVMALVSQAIAASVNSGWATAYSGPYDMDATGRNMCGFNARRLPDKWQVYYGAMNEADWNAAGGKGGICGRCIRVTGMRGQTTRGHKIKPIYVKIVDQCPSWACNKGSVDFSTSALKAITGFGWDKKKIKWSFASCPSAGRKLAMSDA
jgi:expansin (peptidoglycan-binding protein)